MKDMSAKQLYRVATIVAKLAKLTHSKSLKRYYASLVNKAIDKKVGEYRNSKK